MKGHCGGMACINYQGKRECAKVVDTLPKANPEGNIDLSIALFQSLIGDLDLGRVPVTWELFPPGSTDFAMDHNPEVKQSASDIQTSNSVESVSPTSSIPPAPSQDVASGNPSSSTEQPPAQGISSVSPGPQPAPILGMEADSEQSASKKKEEEAKEQERKKAEEENARKAAEEKRKKAEEATARKAAGEEKQKAEEETARKAATEEQERKKAEEETARKAVIEEQETKEAADGEHADPAKAEDSKVTETEQVEGEHFGTSVESTSAATSPSNPAGSAELPASTTLDLPAKEGTSTSQDNWLIAHQTFNGDTMTTSMHTPTRTTILHNPGAKHNVSTHPRTLFLHDSIVRDYRKHDHPVFHARPTNDRIDGKCRSHSSESRCTREV
ncbi:hypothetical protein M7I_4790 [Glarea lozoyensis 74030]|uniref:Uncharacterized protein n=1 Tax=Glarea lozoyensis (strain ATCC 74030 / MF5533) TaxID=1104152 RepID=H0EQ47_GLAL7|nr:hypothetical protein M7I_4790 [Glarea lozoyensis 74030]